MSNEQKHTPGPWYSGHLGDPSIRCECRTVVSEAYAGGICTVHIDNGKGVSDGGNDCPPREEAIANMHLIAAAPDLLAALKEAREGLATFLQDNGYDVSRAPRIQAIDAAISKAEGTQP